MRGCPYPPAQLKGNEGWFQRLKAVTDLVYVDSGSSPIPTWCASNGCSTWTGGAFFCALGARDALRALPGQIPDMPGLEVPALPGKEGFPPSSLNTDDFVPAVVPRRMTHSAPVQM